MDEKKLLLKFVAGLIGGGLLGDYVATKIQNRKMKEAIVATTKDLEYINHKVEDMLERRNNYKEVVNDLLKDEEVAKA